MRTFFLIHVNVHDFPKYQEYINGAMPIIMKNGGKIIVADNQAEQMEGTSPSALQVVIEFPNDEKAMAWYNDPEYKKVKNLRHEAADTISISKVKEFELPK